FRSLLQVNQQDFGYAGRLDRRSAAARSPLVLSGLVLAGANRPVQGVLADDGGILTAETIARLPLGGLGLAVLSACDTGLGDVAAGEGVFGLQRPFHLGGTHNVVASLWKVDDQATAALMAVFYARLWDPDHPLPPGEALREAQLTLYRHPERIAVLAGERGPE